MQKLNRKDAARLGHYKQNLRKYIAIDPGPTPRRERQLDALSWYPAAARKYFNTCPIPEFRATCLGSYLDGVLWVGAVLSPMTSFAQNVEDTRRFFRFVAPWVLRCRVNGVSSEEIRQAILDGKNPSRLTAFPKNTVKAVDAVVLGTIKGPPPGPKVAAFYEALKARGGYYRDQVPVVDTWMLRAAKAPTKNYPRSMRLVQRALTELYEDLCPDEFQLGRIIDDRGIPHEVTNVHALQALIWSNIREANW